MKTQAIIRRARLGTAMAALAIALGTVGAAAPAVAQPTAAKPAETLTLSKGTGTLVRLSEPMSDVFVANDTIADVQVRSSNQLYVFGKGSGETTVYATSKGGRVVYAANVRVGNNISSVGEMLHLARAADGRWSGGGDLPALTGAEDCDLGLSPLTNTMPIRRHRLHEEPGAVECTMAWVSVPDLGVHVSVQRYEHLRTTPTGAVVRFASGDFTADLVVDAAGFVVDYPDLARRVTGP